MSFILDASAVLRFTDNEAGADRVEDVLNDAARGNATVLISAVNWGEVAVAMYKRNSSTAPRIIGGLSGLPINIAPVDAGLAEFAARFKQDYKLPFADCFAVALTVQTSIDTNAKAILITADYDFKSVPKNIVKIEYLPIK